MNDATPITADAMPEGDYAIVEILGHRTMIGRSLFLQQQSHPGRARV